MRLRGIVLRLLAAVTAVAALVALLTTVPSLGGLLVPAVALGIVLLAGLFPGEAAIERLRDARSTPRMRGPSTIRRPSSPAIVRRVGRLMAFALAIRPPPAVQPALV